MKHLRNILVAVLLAAMMVPSVCFATDSVAAPEKFVVVRETSKTYDGKLGCVEFTVYENGEKTSETAKFVPADAGTYTVTDPNGETVTYTINKASQSIKTTFATKTVKRGKSATIVVSNKSSLAGKITYKSSSKYVKVSKSGKITVSKKAKKGKTYTIKVYVAGDNNHKGTYKTIKIKVK